MVTLLLMLLLSIKSLILFIRDTFIGDAKAPTAKRLLTERLKFDNLVI